MVYSEEGINIKSNYELELSRLNTGLYLLVVNAANDQTRSFSKVMIK